MTSRFRNFGIGVEMCSIKQMLRFAELGEQQGFDSFWLGEDCYWRGAFALAATILARTSSIRVGLGIVNPFTRHPVLTAMETACLAEAAGSERVLLAIGASVKSWIQGQMNIPYVKPRRSVQETVEIIRAMFSGEEVHYQGERFQVNGAKLSMSPIPKIPLIYLGVEGPKNLELAGEIGDGVVLSLFASPQYVRFAMEHIRMGAAKKGRSLENFDVKNYMVISIDEDREIARNAVKPIVGVALGVYGPILGPESPVLSSVVSWDEMQPVIDATRRGDPVVPLITDSMIDGFTIAGTPEECQDKLQAMLDLGVTSPIAFDVPCIDLEAMLPKIKQFLFPAPMKTGHY